MTRQAAAFCAAALSAAAPVSFAADRPNVVLFLVDDMGNLHLRDFDLVVDATNGRRATVNGIQIVQVPEPGLVLPGALAAFALLRRRRSHQQQGPRR